MSERVAPADPRALIDIPVRPEADAFRMLDPEAFVDLAAGIHAHGQMDPIELDTDGAIGDGRNRYAACRWLEIEPICVTLPAETDWFARVVERNLNRRHATPGARAVALVRADGSQGTSTRDLGRIAGLGHSSIVRARFVVEHAPDLAAQVEAGASLRAAYEEALRAERERADAERSAVDEEARRMASLEALERERDGLIGRVYAARAGLGDPVVIPPEPMLAITIATPDDAERATVPPVGADVDSLRAQERLHAQMRKVKSDIEAVAMFDIGPDAPMFEGLVLAVRSWASQVVASTYRITERYNALLDDHGQLRRVK